MTTCHAAIVVASIVVVLSGVDLPTGDHAAIVGMVASYYGDQCVRWPGIMLYHAAIVELIARVGFKAAIVHLYMCTCEWIYSFL